MMIFIEDDFASFLASKLLSFSEVVVGSLELIDGVICDSVVTKVHVTHIVRW